jgi:hypothetical protein
MLPPTKRMGVALLLTGLTLVGCTKTEALGEASDDAAKVEQVAGEDFNRVTLTAAATTALGIRTEPVREVRRKIRGGVMTLQVIPYAAVIYDAEGNTSTYVSVGPRSYVRAAITLDHLKDDLAYLRQSVEPTASVVTVGAPELLGVEEGVDGE